MKIQSKIVLVHLSSPVSRSILESSRAFITVSRNLCRVGYPYLTQIAAGSPFSFTKGGKLVTYSGDHPTSNILQVEFQACSNAAGKIVKDPQENSDWVGRLRVLGTNTCIDLSVKDKNGFWLPKIATCNARKLTPGQTWRYDTVQFGLFWVRLICFRVLSFVVLIDRIRVAFSISAKLLTKTGRSVVEVTR